MIDKETVKHVAKIARINLTEEEIDKFSRQLNDIVEDFKILDELDVENVAPSFHPIRTENVLREDEVKECLKREEIFKIACHKEGDYFKAPKIM
ncbi:MAG: Asp-tRNA(Asn)/Glu-tRNA(Gln) amidotransferase subunit GatC [Candidatus Nanoarchaeia archaeon]|nr:Asp-tRNA(Asn)/Glu-tRNA(Gln) amidotransferase subunit GatC [Candidatus Nanoarchaeia archaeon]